MRIEHTGGAAEAGIAAGIGQFLEQRLEQKHRKELMDYQAELNLEKEKRNLQWEFEAEQRARAWQIEKLGIISRLDFEREEKERQRKLNEIDAARKQIHDTDWIDDTTRAEKLEELDIQEEAVKLGVPLTARMVAPELYQKQLTPAQQAAKRALEGETLDGETTVLTVKEVFAGPGEIYVISPDGEPGKIPIEDLPEALSEGGYTLAPGQAIPKSETFQRLGAEWQAEQKELLRPRVKELVEGYESYNPVRALQSEWQLEKLARTHNEEIVRELIEEYRRKS